MDRKRQREFVQAEFEKWLKGEFGKFKERFASTQPTDELLTEVLALASQFNLKPDEAGYINTINMSQAAVYAGSKRFYIPTSDPKVLLAGWQIHGRNLETRKPGRMDLLMPAETIVLAQTALQRLEDRVPEGYTLFRASDTDT